MSKTPLFGKYYDHGSSRKYQEVNYECSGVLSDDDNEFVFGDRDVELRDSNGNVIAKLDLSDVDITGISEWNNNSVIANPGEVIFLPGVEYGKTYEEVYFEIPEILTQYGNWCRFVNLEFDFSYNVNFNRKAYSIRTKLDSSSGCNIEHRIDEIFKHLGIDDLQITLEHDCSAGVHYFKFMSNVLGYEFIVSNMKVYPVWQTAEFPDSPFIDSYMFGQDDSDGSSDVEYNEIDEATGKVIARGDVSIFYSDATGEYAKLNPRDESDPSIFYELCPSTNDGSKEPPVPPTPDPSGHVTFNIANTTLRNISLDASYPGSKITDSSIIDCNIINFRILDCSVLDSAALDSSVIDSSIRDSSLFGCLVSDSSIYASELFDTSVVDSSAWDSSLFDCSVTDSSLHNSRSFVSVPPLADSSLDLIDDYLNHFKEFRKDVSAFIDDYIADCVYYYDSSILKDRTVFPLKYPNGASRIWFIVPDFPYDSSIQEYSLELNHVSDRMIIFNKDRNDPSVYFRQDVYVDANERNQYEYADISGNWNSTKYVKVLMPDDIAIHTSIAGIAQIRPILFDTSNGSAPDSSELYEFNYTHIGMYKYIEVINNSDLWTNFGQEYSVITAADDPQSNVRNLANSVYIMNRNSFPIKINYFTAS